MTKKWFLPGLMLICGLTAHAQIQVSFEQAGLAENEFKDGYAATLGTFQTELTLGGATFYNQYTRSDWGYGLTESFSGFAASKVSDNSTVGYINQYSCIAGKGAYNSNVYGLFWAGFGPVQIDFEEIQIPGSVSICNSTYAYFSMKNGDAFSKKFGGENGDDPDFFLLKIIGLRNEIPTDTICFYLADLRFEDPNQDYLVRDWTNIDLSSLGEINRLQFELSSSDVGDWGMNTPAYFCIDNLNSIDFEGLTFNSGDVWNGSSAALKDYSTIFSEDPVRLTNRYTLADWGWGMTGNWTGWSLSSMTDRETPGYLNQYSAIAGSGANGSSTYALCWANQGTDTLHLEGEYQVDELFLTNGTYGYFSMRDGDPFSKKFGGASGDDPDFFKVTISGLLNGQTTANIDFYLADFRFADNTQDYIINEWTPVDLSGLGTVDQLLFSLSSSDMGDWGMNTPAYFFLDEISLSGSMGIKQTKLENKILIYPNPAENVVSLESTENIQHIEIFSITGHLVKTLDIDNGAKKIKLNISDLPSGNYLIKTSGPTHTATSHIIKT